MKITKYPKTKENPFGYIEVVPDDFSPTKVYPLVVHAHGVGGNGNGSEVDLEKLVKGELPEQIQKAADVFQLVVIATQVSDYADGEFEHALLVSTKNAKINTAKRYLCGTSFGGGRITRWLSQSVANAKTFAGAVSSCGLNWISTAKNIADANLPMIFFHATDDGTVGVNATHQAVSSINAFPMTVPAKKVIYPAGQHWIWNKVFHATENPWTGNESPKTIWDYLLMLEVGKPLPVPFTIPDTSVLIDAGPDQVVTTPNIRLDGSRSRNYKTISWSIDRNPAGVNIWNVFTKGSGWHTVDAFLEKPGTYIFKLTGTDAAGTKVEDTVQVTYSTVTPIPEPTWKPTSRITRKDGTKEDVIIETI